MDSKLYSYCALLYETFLSKSQVTQGLTVWQGALLTTIDDIKIPRGSYKKVVDSLRAMGCIEFVERGKRGNTPSVFILHHPPTEPVWDDFVKSARRDLTGNPNLDSLSAEVKELQAFVKSLGGLDIVEAFKNLDNRVKVLEATKTTTT